MQLQAPLPALARVVAKYKRDVHVLPEGASVDALVALEGHLTLRLPPGLRQFLSLHNGAALFRGALRLRGAAELAPASGEARRVILFADGHDDTRWAWAPWGEGHAFGPWDGTRLEPLHSTFAGWLSGALSVIETRVGCAEDREQLRLEADPDDAFQLARAGVRALRAGHPEEAARALSRATSRDPHHVEAWQVLGDALAVCDRGAAREAWLQALRRARFPLPFPGAPCVGPELVRSLGGAFADPEDWERELQRLLAERVQDVATPAAARAVQGVARALARSLVARGRRVAARDVLSDLVARGHVFSLQHTPWDVVLELARLEVDLGHHDEAEALLRRLEREGAAHLHGSGRLLLAQIAITRQEPWAEEILEEARRLQLGEADRVRAAVLQAERAVRQDRIDVAAKVLAGVREVARRSGRPALQAAVALAEGDVERCAGRCAQAAARYAKAHQLVGEGDPELRGRVELHMGDLAWAEGRRADARAAYTRAARQFSRFELPVREAWALVRLARAAGRDGAPMLQAARELFNRADLAAGVATVDSLCGDPGASLAWHMERATAHARARHDAQRSRPPLRRSDADRPERRLGAHRLAVAACDEGVVGTIARELDACARAASSGRGRALDPPVLRYIAAVDLLSGHRSYGAADVLLKHLLERTVDGPAYRALQGAIARAPNAALVDGLLRCVEQPRSHPSHAVAAAAELLGLRREPAAVRPLVALGGPGAGPVTRRAAIVALGRIGNRSAVECVARALEEPKLAEQAALALLMLGDRRGVDFHGKALIEHRADLSGHPGELVGRYGGPEHLLLLTAAADGVDERALGALQGLGLLGDARGVPRLLEALHARERRVVEIASGALQILLGHREDLETPGVRNRWLTWWAQHEGDFPEGVRYRDGRPLDCGILLERMAHDDAWTRRTAYDELVISTGKDLPFDADGPWRVQQAHLRAWRRWWGQARHGWKPGWYLDGCRIG